VAFWKDRPEDDGAVHATETALRRVADAAVSDAVRALRRALHADDLERQHDTTMLLMLARQLRDDLDHGACSRLGAKERHQLRRAFLMVALLACAHGPIPIA
jgi:hypothetical protein